MRRPTYVVQRRKLDKKVVFERRSTARDDFNQPTKAGWDNLFETRCALYPAPGQERFTQAQGATSATANMMIEVRSEARTLGLLPSDRALVDGVPYLLAAPPVQPERGSNLQIYASADVRRS
jgi:hypothetical protein